MNEATQIIQDNMNAYWWIGFRFGLPIGIGIGAVIVLAFIVIQVKFLGDK